jgi:uncharacterized membrane protein required for colicin V production
MSNMTTKSIIYGIIIFKFFYSETLQLVNSWMDDLIIATICTFFIIKIVNIKKEFILRIHIDSNIFETINK